MKHCLSLFIAVLVGMALSSCSRHSSVVATPRVTWTNLGVVEVSDGVPIRHALGDGRAYILTPTVSNDGRIEMKLDLEVTNSSGAVETLQGPTETVFPGNEARVAVADVGIHITPKTRP